MNFPIIMSLWLMRQGLDDDTDTDMTNASALESAAFALCCIVAATILCVASAFAWDLLSDFHFFLNDSMALLAAYIIFLFVSVVGSIGFGVVAVCELVYLYRVQTPERKVIVQRALFLLSATAALVCITASNSKESNKTEPDTLTFQAGAPITTQHLVPETDSPTIYPRAWENVRGRGERNRTHDCAVDDCALYKANLVEYDPPVEMVEFERPNAMFKGTAKAKYFKPQEGEIILRHYQTEPERHVFVSAEKSGEWNWNRTSAANARANFELYDGEYINLTYLNSVWLEYVVTNKSLGDWRIGGIAVDYAYAIRYLKTALDYIRKREEGEKALLDAIDPSICQDAEWPVKLSEWKLRAGVRTITEYQAKRFATALGKEAQAHG